MSKYNPQKQDKNKFKHSNKLNKKIKNIKYKYKNLNNKLVLLMLKINYFNKKSIKSKSTIIKLFKVNIIKLKREVEVLVGIILKKLALNNLLCLIMIIQTN